MLSYRNEHDKTFNSFIFFCAASEHNAVHANTFELERNAIKFSLEYICKYALANKTTTSTNILFSELQQQQQKKKNATNF